MAFSYTDVATGYGYIAISQLPPSDTYISLRREPSIRPLRVRAREI